MGFKKIEAIIRTEKLEEVREEEKKKKKTLVDVEDYVKAGVHIGTKVITPHMRYFVYRRRNDGIAIINTNQIDQKLKEGIEFLKEYAPNEFIVVCKREAGWKAVEKFSELTGVRVFTKKYPAGILTNTKLPDFFENELKTSGGRVLGISATGDTLRDALNNAYEAAQLIEFDGMQFRNDIGAKALATSSLTQLY